MSYKPASSVSEGNRNLKSAGWGCVVGCGLLGGSITPLACNTSNFVSRGWPGSSLVSQPDNFFRGWSEGGGAREKYGLGQRRYDMLTSSYLNYNIM